MVGLKYIGGVLVTIVLCGLIWLVHPAKVQVNELEKQISRQYVYTNFLLRDTVEELLAWDFSQPLTDADEEYLSELSKELLYTTSLIFSGNVIHHEWRSRMHDMQGHITNYVYGSSLSDEDIADLQQALQATRFISMDFEDLVENTQDFYDSMHDEQHEMVQRVKSRLATQY